MVMQLYLMISQTERREPVAVVYLGICSLLGYRVE